MSPVNQLRMGIERSTRSVTVGCGGRASTIGRSFVRRTVGMCVMNSDSGLGSCGACRCCSPENDPWSMPVAVAELAVGVDSSDCACSSVSSSTSGTLDRLFIANDRGNVERSCALPWRKVVECDVLSVRGVLDANCPATAEPFGMGTSSDGP